MSIIASDGVDAAVQHRDANVASLVVHGSHLVPVALDGVELAHAVEMLQPVKAADAVDEVVEKDGAVVGARTLRVVGHVDPAVGTDVVRLDAVGGTAAAPAADGQQDASRQPRAGQGVADAGQIRPDWEQLGYCLGGFREERETRSLRQRTGQHFVSDVVHVQQGQPDLQRNDKTETVHKIELISLDFISGPDWIIF